MLYRTTDSSPTSKIFRAHANRKPLCSLWKNIPILRIKRGPVPHFAKLKKIPGFSWVFTPGELCGFVSRKLAVSDPFDLGPQVSTSQLTPSPRKVETKNPRKIPKNPWELFWGVELPCQHFGWFFFFETTKKFSNNPGDEFNKGAGLILTPRCWENWWHVGVPTPSIENCTFEDGSINSIRVVDTLFVASFLGNFRWMQKNLHVQSFLVNKHVISWFFKIPVPFSKAFFHVPKEKTFFRSPWASEAEKKLQYRLGEDCYSKISKSTGGS